MKKLAIFMVMTIILSAFTVIGVSAHYDGLKTPMNLDMPKINPANPAIVIDGKVDIDNGEWYGATEYVMDYTVSDDNEQLYDLTIWSPEVWITDGSAWSLGTPDELPPEWQIVFYNYLMWDGDGIYLATTYKTSLEANALNAGNIKEWEALYMDGTADSSNTLVPNTLHMILPTDDPVAYVATEGKWFDVYASSDGTAVWTEGYTGYHYKNVNELTADIKACGYKSPTADADGKWTFGYEMFLPWSFLNLDNEEEATTTMFDFYGDEGVTIQVGFITRVRNAMNAENLSELPYIQFTDSQGWRNYNFYKLTGTAETYAGATSAPVEETPAPVEETPAPVEEAPAPVEETPAPVEEAPAPAPAPVVSAPQTADPITLILCIAAITGSAVVITKKRG